MCGPTSRVARLSFGKYEVLARLATGGAASIFLARQPGAAGFNKLVCLKTLLPERASDEDFVRMFLDEARLAARLHHPNCVQIYDLGRVDQVYYISMEYIFGETLWNLLTTVTRLKTPLPPTHVAAIVANVCDGLHHAHDLKDQTGRPLNLVHRDVSPQNVMVSFEGQTKVVDFGIAKAETDRPPTVAGIVKGKFSYMSPEQITGNAVDRRSDVYSLGIVMFECLASRRLYRGDTPEEIARLILEHRAPRLRDVVPKVPAPLDEICAKALSRNPQRRFQTAHAMGTAIRDYLSSVRFSGNATMISRLMSERFDEVLTARRRAFEAATTGEYDETALCEALGAQPVRHLDLYADVESGRRPTGDTDETEAMPRRGPTVHPATVPRIAVDPVDGAVARPRSRFDGPGWQVEVASSGSVALPISIRPVDELTGFETPDVATTHVNPELQEAAQPHAGGQPWVSTPVRPSTRPSRLVERSRPIGGANIPRDPSERPAFGPRDPEAPASEPVEARAPPRPPPTPPTEDADPTADPRRSGAVPISAPAFDIEDTPDLKPAGATVTGPGANPPSGAPGSSGPAWSSPVPQVSWVPPRAASAGAGRGTVAETLPDHRPRSEFPVRPARGPKLSSLPSAEALGPVVSVVPPGPASISPSARPRVVRRPAPEAVDSLATDQGSSAGPGFARRYSFATVVVALVIGLVAGLTIGIQAGPQLMLFWRLLAQP